MRRCAFGQAYASSHIFNHDRNHERVLMSRGLGKIQRLCLAVLKDGGKLDSIEIVARALDKRIITESEHVSFRRALRSLKAKGLVVDMTRHWCDNRRRWALPEQAWEYYMRVAKTFGTAEMKKEMQKGGFTQENYPDFF